MYSNTHAGDANIFVTGDAWPPPSRPGSRATAARRNIFATAAGDARPSSMTMAEPERTVSTTRELSPPDDEARVRRLEALLRIDERLSKLEEAERSSKGGRSRLMHPATLAALLGVVPPMTSAVYGAVSGFYAERIKMEESRAGRELQRQETEAGRMQKYLELALDDKVPLMNRLQMMRYIAGSEDARMAAWAKTELARLDQELAAATSAKQTLKQSLLEKRHEREELARAIETTEEKFSDDKAIDPVLKANYRKLSVLDEDIDRSVQTIGELSQRISDAPDTTPLAADAAAPASEWIVQVTTDKTLEAARYDQKLLERAGFSSAVYRRGPFFLVTVGPFASRGDAMTSLPKIREIRDVGAIVHSMKSWCPNLQIDADGVHNCR